MRFEILESREMLAVATGVGDVPASNIRSVALRAAAQSAEASEVFSFDSDVIAAETIAAVNEGDKRLTATNEWYKPVAYQSPLVSAEGYLVAKRTVTDVSPHTMFVARVRDSDCFGVEGIYTLPQHHYTVSFDVRFPSTESSWLGDHAWAIVMQLWGPRENGETPRQPPLSIHTKSIDGHPVWRVLGYGDARRITQTGDYQEEFTAEVPFTGIGEWQRWSLELVPDPFGNGLVRAWLNGVLVGEWTGIQFGYNSMLGGAASGPLNPAFGLYAPLAGNGMEAHFDKIKVQCDGVFERSIAGVLTNGAPEATTIVARDVERGSTFTAQPGRDGVYALNVPAGQYTIKAVDRNTGWHASETKVDVRTAHQLVDLELRPQETEPPDSLTLGDARVLIGDVDGDGAKRSHPRRRERKLVGHAVR